MRERAIETGLSVFDMLHEQLNELKVQQQLIDCSLLTKKVHVLPYWHGNRSPRADPTLTGVIGGLSFGTSLPVLYLATLQVIPVEIVSYLKLLTLSCFEGNRPWEQAYYRGNEQGMLIKLLGN